MKFSLKTRFAVALLVIGSGLSLGLGAADGGASAPGGTITFAEAPGGAPDWIFPYTGYRTSRRPT
jgi:hypothetical protein